MLSVQCSFTTVYKQYISILLYTITPNDMKFWLLITICINPGITLYCSKTSHRSLTHKSTKLAFNNWTFNSGFEM